MNSIVSKLQFEAIYYRNRGCCGNDSHMRQTAALLESAVALIQDQQDSIDDLSQGYRGDEVHNDVP